MRIRLIPFLLVFSLLCACGEESGVDATPAAGSYLLYFVAEERRDGAALGAEPFAPQEGADVVEALLEALLAGPTGHGLTSPFPAGVELRQVSLGEDGVLYLDFSEQYDALTGIQLTLANYCLTLTLTQVEGVEALSITVEGMANPAFQSGPLTAGQAILSGAEEDVTQRTAALWFPRSDGSGLEVEYRTLSLTAEASLSQALLEALSAGPTQEGLSPVLPEGSTPLGATIEGGVCYVNFSQEFRTGMPESGEALRLLAYAVVNTMAGNLDAVSSVQLLVEGEPLPALDGLALDGPLEPDTSLENG